MGNEVSVWVLILVFCLFKARNFLACYNWADIFLVPPLLVWSKLIVHSVIIVLWSVSWVKTHTVLDLIVRFNASTCTQINAFLVLGCRSAIIFIVRLTFILGGVLFIFAGLLNSHFLSIVYLSLDLTIEKGQICSLLFNWVTIWLCHWCWCYATELCWRSLLQLLLGLMRSILHANVVVNSNLLIQD